MNVFTIVDNFKYQDKNGADAFLTQATADYSVIGWHSTEDFDPLTTTPPANITGADLGLPSHADRIHDCKMQMKNDSAETTKAWLTADNNAAPSRILCHGSMYQVEYARALKTNVTVLAEAAGQRLKETQPVAVGTTPIDAILSYCRAHLNDDLSDPRMHELEQDLIGLSTMLMQADGDDVDGLQAASDQSFQQAFQNFEGGSKWLFKQQTAPNEKPQVPSPDQMKNLVTLNALQSVRENAARELADLQWQLFAKWWDFVSGFADSKLPTQFKARLMALSTDIDTLTSKITNLDAQIQGWVNPTGGKKVPPDLLDLEKVTDSQFYQRKDPTLLFGNLDRGWDADFTSLSQVRLHSQAVSKGLQSEDGDFARLLSMMDQLCPDGSPRIPPSLLVGVKSLLHEFYQLDAEFAVSANEGQVLPSYHDGVDNVDKTKQIRSRDFWQSKQPWRPLMIEWEAVYYHVPMSHVIDGQMTDLWRLKEFENLSNWGATTVHYGVDEQLSKLGISDVRHVSGRNILLPQAASTLTTMLKTVFANTARDDLIQSLSGGHPDALSLAGDDAKNSWLEAEMKTILDIAGSLQMVSAPLTGLTSHLLTMHEGSHVKPLVRFPNCAPIPIDAACNALLPAIMIGNDSMTQQEASALARTLVMKMGVETMLTPYGDSVQQEASFHPMKPVTHGQLLFTKVNIVDKFGQVISAIDPRPMRRDKTVRSMLPCLADSYYPGTLSGISPTDPNARANTIIDQNSNACPFISLTPSINQPARINAQFVQKDTDGKWRRCSDWDNPIWGWLVVNYADNGLQLFLADGTFYREVRMGGKFGDVAGRKFLPFDKPTVFGPDVKDRQVTQLDFLIQKLATPGDATFLQGFFDMIMQSMDDKQAHVPKSYATHSSAIVGKPLALANAGWSLELGNTQRTNQSTVNTTAQDRYLLDPNAARDDPKGGALPVHSPKGYTFPIKLGDSERSYDGLIGYFPASPITTSPPPSTSTPPSSDLDLSKLYTYFTSSLPADAKIFGSDPRISLFPTDRTTPLPTPVHLTPYHLTGLTTPSLDLHDDQLTIFGMILDPFLPVHAYSSILPIKPLQLPTWAVEKALSRMTAFWKAGPLLVTRDVPKGFDEQLALVGEYAGSMAPSAPPFDGTGDVASTVPITLPAAPGPVLPPGITPPKDSDAGQDQKIPVPLISIPLSPPTASHSGASAVYRWLQPYWVKSTGADAASDKGPDGGAAAAASFETRFNAFGVSDDGASGADAATLRLEGAPYTAIEGYVQVVKALEGSGAF